MQGGLVLDVVLASESAAILKLLAGEVQSAFPWFHWSKYDGDSITLVKVACELDGEW